MYAFSRTPSQQPTRWDGGMRYLEAPPAVDRRAGARRAGIRRLVIVAFVLCIAVLLLVLAAVLPRIVQATVGFAPGAADGHIADGTVVTLADEELPAIARLTPELLQAMRAAEVDAADEGIRFEVTSGWRSEAYQRWLLQEAIELYASEEVARQYVATPDRSKHVTGDAVDIASLDAQLWLIEHGSRYGICQTYANERWHFELATSPGGTCPEMQVDAVG